MPYLCADRYAAYTAIDMSSVTANRSSGVAPLGIILDCAGITDASVDNPKMSLLTVDWGDPSSGTWTLTNGRSKNVGYGMCPAHVYLTPGTYNPIVYYFNGLIEKSVTLEIVVESPDVVFAGTDETIIVAQDGDFTGAPDGTQVTSGDYDAVLTTYAAAKRRIRFKGGNTYTSSAFGPINSASPIRIETWGAGKANVTATDAHAINRYSSLCADVAIQGLAINGSGNAAQAFAAQFSTTPANLTIWDCTATDLQRALSFPDDSFNGLIVGQCDFNTFIGGAGSVGAILNGTKFALLGSHMNDATAAEHVLRASKLIKSCISDSILENPAVNKHCLKLNGPTYVDDNYTENVWLTFNKYIDNAENPVMCEWGPQNTTSDERLRDIYSLNEWYVGAENTQVALRVYGVERGSVINPIFSFASWAAGVDIGKRGVEPHPSYISVYNASAFVSVGDGFTGVRVRAGATSSVVKNFLAYAPGATLGNIGVVADAGTGTVTGNNSSDSQTKNTCPFTDAMPTDPSAGDFNPADYAVGGGVVVNVFDDYLGTRRSYGNKARVIDAGAVQTS